MILQIEVSVLRTTDMLFSDVIKILDTLSGVRRFLHGRHLSYRKTRTSIPQIPHHLLVVVDVDVRLLPLASRDVAREHDVDLAVRSALHLRQAKVCDDQADEGGGTPYEAALAAEVATRGVQHVGRNYRSLVSSTP